VIFGSSFVCEASFIFIVKTLQEELHTRVNTTVMGLIKSLNLTECVVILVLANTTSASHEKLVYKKEREGHHGKGLLFCPKTLRLK